MGAPDIKGPQKVVTVTPPDVPYPPQFWRMMAVNRSDGYLAIDPNNSQHLVGICRRFYGQGVDYQDVLEAQYSFDGGNTWNTTGLPLDLTEFYSISDPWIGIGPDGTVYAIGLAVVTTNNMLGAAEAATAAGNGVLCFTSADGGITWGQPVAIVNGTWCDQTFGAVDPTSGRVYAIWFDESLAFAYSDDKGQTWQASASAQPNNTKFDLGNAQFNFVNMSIGPDGAVHIIGCNDQGAMAYARSLDNGKSFEFGQIATTQTGVNNIQGVLQAFEKNPYAPSLAVVNPPAILAVPGLQEPLVYAAWSVDTGQGAPLIRICVTGSANNGQNWISNLAGNDAPAAVPFLPLGTLPQTGNDHYFRPRLCAGPQGTIACAFSYCNVGAPLDPLIPVYDQLPVQFGTCLAVSSATEVIIKNKRGPVLGFYFEYFNPSATTVVTVSNRLSRLYSVNPVLRWGIKGAYFIGDFIGACANSTTIFVYWSESTVGWQLLVSGLVFGT